MSSVASIHPLDTPAARPLQLHQAQRAVELHPGYTSAQLAEITGAKRDLLLDRLYELQDLGLVHAAELTICRHTGRPATVWRPGRDPHLVDPAQQALL